MMRICKHCGQPITSLELELDASSRWWDWVHIAKINNYVMCYNEPIQSLGSKAEPADLLVQLIYEGSDL